MISLIGAMGQNRVLGFAHKLLWHLPDDLKQFKIVTKGHPIIMGRKTYESIGRLLPERLNIIITRDTSCMIPGAIVVHSIEDALKIGQSNEEVFIIGGGEIYKLGLPFADRMYLTFINADFEGDTFFPQFDESEWNVIEEKQHPIDAYHPYSFVYKVYEKKP